MPHCKKGQKMGPTSSAVQRDFLRFERQLKRGLTWRYLLKWPFIWYIFFCFYPEVKVKSGGVVGKVTVGHPVITGSFRHIKSADFFFKNGHYEERPWFEAVENTFEIPPWKLYWRNERRLLFWRVEKNSSSSPLNGEIPTKHIYGNPYGKPI